MDITDSDFEEKVMKASAGKPVVVDFWAEWCMPCKMLKPIMEKLEKEYKGRFILAKVNVESANEAAQRFDVSSIPAVLMIKDGKVVADFIGSKPEARVKEWLDENL